MKLFINATHFYEHPSGLGVYTKNLVRALLSIHDQIKVFTGNPDIGCSNQQLVITPKWLNPRKGTIGHILRILWENSYLWIQTLRERPHILFSTVHEGVALPLVHTKQVITLHDTIALKFPQYFKRLKYYFTHFLPLVIKNSQAIVCVSENTKKDLLDYYKLNDKPVYVVYPGYDRDVFFPRYGSVFTKRFGKYFLFVGDMRPHKNLERLIKAVNELRCENFKLLIVGKKDMRFYPALWKMVRGYKLEEKVLFLDYVPLEDLPYLYSGAEAFVFPSLYEGFGLPLIEAMACGCPVIASDIPPLREVCDQSAYYVDPYDTHSVACALYQLLTNNSLKRRLRMLGLWRAKYFSWEKSARQHMSIFEELMA
ncbi:glycosyltransferase family 4 protein [Hydrogenobacter hydrogenophilus]|uniref:Glycosyltransferase involved in cell wall bisynthesis n=1 Tax=Hydrogenobacter hydrogenophilus TaxID=35835 RepID=A0A285P407_9AQUI|nr:glycosyltransferase family 1 protein [Hydrogenobacter hydrogenophilus]SNZ16465.1 Glycosyltransferase involved in cell wall bisynthesis [Hydrogenobacter hydrogenophilus]